MTKSNMYEGVTSINPLGGKCQHNCLYCSTNTLRERWEACNVKYSGPYRLYGKELMKFRHKYGPVFVCGQNDLFEAHMSSDIINTVLKYILDHGHRDNVYMFQSKDPILMEEYAKDYMCGFGQRFKSMWGTTIETDDESIVLSDAPSYTDRRDAMKRLKKAGVRTYITIEPIVKFTDGFADFIADAEPNLIYIGADSKNNHLPEPSKAELDDLISRLQTRFNLNLKSNLNRLLRE